MSKREGQGQNRCRCGRGQVNSVFLDGHVGTRPFKQIKAEDFRLAK